MNKLAIICLCLLLSACANTVKNQDAAKALDIARRLHFALCEDRAPTEDEAAACEWAYSSLVQLEPGMEDALAKHAALQQAWAVVKPYAMALVQQAIPMVWPWILSKLPQVGGV